MNPIAFPTLFWSILLIFIGVSLIFKQIFGTALPMDFIIGALLVYLGLRIIYKNRDCQL